MDKKIIFLSDGSLHTWQDGEFVAQKSLIYEDYKRKIREIEQKNEWKKAGSGAAFMGVYFNEEASAALDYKVPINGIAFCQGSKIVYSLNFEKSNGLYIKNIQNVEEKEYAVMVNANITFHELDVDSQNNIIVSIGAGYFEKHLALMHTDNSDFTQLTEGDCLDQNPRWSKKYPDVIYYDSCGIAFTDNGHFLAYGPRSIYRFNTKTKELDEVLSDDNFDFYCPYQDENGDLFYIKRPYKPRQDNKNPIKDFLLAPFKILRAIGGWLDFFTVRYTGENLKTSGPNPAKHSNKTPEELFVDGNLLKAEQNLKNNMRMGDAHPGYIPKDWQLMVKSADGEEKVLKHGVLSYCMMPKNELIYSNGQYIIFAESNSKEKVLAKAHLATKISAEAPQ